MNLTCCIGQCYDMPPTESIFSIKDKYVKTAIKGAL